MIRALIFSFLFLSSHLYSQNFHLVEAGKGIDKIYIGESAIEEIKESFGRKYKITKSWSVACSINGRCLYATNTWLKYKSGLTFLFYAKEAPKGKKHVQGKLRAIEINSPFKVETTEGIRLKETTYKELIDIRGGAKEMSIENDILIVFYEGIEFYFKAKSTPHNKLSYSDFLDSPLIRIAITK